MSMLAEPRRKQRIGPNPRGKFFTEDDDNRGRQMLLKMGWKTGDGLGASCQGMNEPIKPKVNTESRGLGFDKTQDPWVAHNEEFEQLLRSLNTNTTSDPNGDSNSSSKIDDENLSNESLEKKSKSLRSRIHYHKFVKNKDLSRASMKDISCIFGKSVDKLAVADESEPMLKKEKEAPKRHILNENDPSSSSKSNKSDCNDHDDTGNLDENERKVSEAAEVLDSESEILLKKKKKKSKKRRLNEGDPTSSDLYKLGINDEDTSSSDQHGHKNSEISEAREDDSEPVPKKKKKKSKKHKLHEDDFHTSKLDKSNCDDEDMCTLDLNGHINPEVPEVLENILEPVTKKKKKKSKKHELNDDDLSASKLNKSDRNEVVNTLIQNGHTNSGVPEILEDELEPVTKKKKKKSKKQNLNEDNLRTSKLDQIDQNGHTNSEVHDSLEVLENEFEPVTKKKKKKSKKYKSNEGELSSSKLDNPDSNDGDACAMDQNGHINPEVPEVLENASEPVTKKKSKKHELNEDDLSTSTPDKSDSNEDTKITTDSEKAKTETFGSMQFINRGSIEDYFRNKRLQMLNKKLSK